MGTSKMQLFVCVLLAFCAVAFSSDSWVVDNWVGKVDSSNYVNLESNGQFTASFNGNKMSGSYTTNANVTPYQMDLVSVTPLARNIPAIYSHEQTAEGRKEMLLQLPSSNDILLNKMTRPTSFSDPSDLVGSRE